MKKFLVVCKETGQTKAFKKDAIEFGAANNIEWSFAGEGNYTEVLSNETVDAVIISPEMLVVEGKIKAELDSRGVKHIAIKPMDYGLRRMDNIVKSIEAIL